MGNYAWILGLLAAWQQHADDEPPGLRMARVDAQAGQLLRPTSNAANDLAAILFVLALFRWWIGAICLANLIVFRSGPFKIVANGRAVFFNPYRPETLDVGMFPAIPGCPHSFSHLCQNEHLPIR